MKQMLLLLGNTQSGEVTMKQIIMVAGMRVMAGVW